MAKNSKNVQKLKEQQFDELIQKNWYYNEVYTYLLKYENEFTNLSLIDFILNCESASGNVLVALINNSNDKDLTIKYIIDQKGYYETDIEPDYKTNYILNDFELYLTKFEEEPKLKVEALINQMRISRKEASRTKKNGIGCATQCAR